MTYAIISIFAFTGIVWLIKKALKLEVCPVCAGVSLTWLWLLIGMKLNLLPTIDYQLPTAILMGGTVVGAMSKLEKFIQPRFLVLWKTAFVAFGFLAVYSLVISDWLIFALGAILAATTTLVFKTHQAQKQESEQAKELEEKMKNCC